MPPKPKFTQEEIAAAALQIIKEQGVEALTARSLGARLGSGNLLGGFGRIQLVDDLALGGSGVVRVCDRDVFVDRGGLLGQLIKLLGADIFLIPALAAMIVPAAVVPG